MLLVLQLLEIYRWTIPQLRVLDYLHVDIANIMMDLEICQGQGRVVMLTAPAVPEFLFPSLWEVIIASTQWVQVAAAAAPRADGATPILHVLWLRHITEYMELLTVVVVCSLNVIRAVVSAHEFVIA
jgi:hypothetical protein